MAAGTRIFLAVLALVAVGLFAYYATVPRQADPPQATEPAATSETEASSQDPVVASILPPAHAATPAEAESDDDHAPARTPVRPAGSLWMPSNDVRDRQPDAAEESTLSVPALLEMGAPATLGEAVDRAEAGNETVEEPPAGTHSTPVSQPPLGTETPQEPEQTSPGGPGETAPRTSIEPARDPMARTAAPDPRAHANRPSTLQYSDYIVQAGDTMISIAASWFGDAGKWDLIKKANPDVNPEKLQIGQKLRMPPRDALRESVRPPVRGGSHRHVVGSGETLSRIAEIYYGDARKWRLIFDANARTIGSNPDELKVGMKLIVPPEPPEKKSTDTTGK